MIGLSKEQEMIVAVLIMIGVVIGTAIGYMLAPKVTVEYTDPPAYNPADHEHTQHGHLGIWLCILISLVLGISRVVIHK